MAGTISLVSRAPIFVGKTSDSKIIERVTVTWTADASNGSVPSLSIELLGWLCKVITYPGGTAPTNNYAVKLIDPNGTSLDALNGALGTLSSSNTQQFLPTVQGTTQSIPLLLAETNYSLQVSGNSVNSATGSIVFYLTDFL